MSFICEAALKEIGHAVGKTNNSAGKDVAFQELEEEVCRVLLMAEGSESPSITHSKKRNNLELTQKPTFHHCILAGDTDQAFDLAEEALACVFPYYHERVENAFNKLSKGVELG